MKEPTEAQIKEFWEWCGQLTDCYWCKGTGEMFYTTMPEKTYPCPSCNSKGHHYPSVDLNNLFKYATDRVKEKIGEKEYFKLLVRWCMKVAMGEDPALALFWAIKESL